MPRRAQALRSCARTRGSTRSFAQSVQRLGGDADEPDEREHGDRPRFDVGLPRRAGALPEHALRPALRALRRRDVSRLPRARAGGLLREAPCVRRHPGHGAADAAGLRHRLRGARRLRADLLAPRHGEALRHVPERRARRTGDRRGQGARRRLEDGVARDRDARPRDPAQARPRDDRRGDLGARRPLLRAVRTSSSRSRRSSSSSAAAGSARRRRSPDRC